MKISRSLASPSGVYGLEELDESSRNQLYFELEALGCGYDRILLDHSSGLHWNVLQFAAAAHQHVVVTTPEPTSYSDAYAIMKILSKRFAVRDFWLIVTQSQQQQESERIIERFMDIARSHLDIRLHLLDIFSWEPRVAESIRKQQAFVERYPLHEMTLRLKKLTVALDGVELRPSHGLSFFYRDQLTTFTAR